MRLGLDALHDTLNRALAEVVAVALHRQAVDADRDGPFAAFVKLIFLIVAVVPGQLQHAVSDEVLAGAVGLHNGLDEIFRHIGVVCQQLLRVLGQAVAAVAEAGVIVMAADARVKTYAVNDLLRAQALALRVGIQLIEIGNAQRQIGVGEQLDGLGSVKPMKRVSMFSLMAPSCSSAANSWAAATRCASSGSVPTMMRDG